jgi:lysozyme
MHISSNGLHLIEQFEGWSATPYWDSYGRVWTRGYGETEGIGPHSPTLTRAQGEANLRRLVATRYEYAIRDLGVPLNQNEWDSLSSTIWNLGPGIIANGTQLGYLLRRKDFTGYANALLAYDHAGGVVLQGLKTRRETEWRLFLHDAQPPPYVPADEARWKREFDALKGKHTGWAGMRRRVLVRVMTARRKRIWQLAEPDGWSILNRKARYRALAERTK